MLQFCVLPSFPSFLTKEHPMPDLSFLTKPEIFSAMVADYIQAMLFANTMREVEGEDCTFDDVRRLSPSVSVRAYLTAQADCALFLADAAEQNAEELASYLSIYSPGDLGSDFALSRNGHGAGFFERPLAPFLLRGHATGLQAQAKTHGEAHWMLTGPEGNRTVRTDDETWIVEGGE